jgi:ABC-type transport system substrate-binding protein
MNIGGKTLLAGAITGATFLGAAGGSMLSSLAANADSTATTAATTTATASPSPGNFDPGKGGHTANGKTEELLTGDTATKVKAAALAAQPGATIQRVETDAEGAAYEAHILKSDSTPATLKFDSSYKLTE